MKITPGYYILNNGQLALMWMDNGRAEMIGAMFEADADEPFWDQFTWTMAGKFDRTSRRSTLDVCERINVGPSAVSYAKQFDFCAAYENDEPDDDGNMRQGFGATELEAVMDLLQSYPGEERAERMREAV